MAHERWPKSSEQNKMHTQQTPKRNDNKLAGAQRTYSTVIKSNLAVTPAGTPRKQTHTISVKIPTPKQGKKDVQIGRPLVKRQLVPRKINPMSKAIHVSNFHPETTTDELADYIVKETDVKDRTKFKCTKLVKI